MNSIFRKQGLTNGHELALQLHEVVENHIEDLGLVTGKDTSHKVKDIEAYNLGYQEGVKFKSHDQISIQRRFLGERK